MSVRLTTQFRRLLAEPGLRVVPGVADALFARIVAEVGFPIVYMSGAGTTAVRLGTPDIGLLSMTEMADNAGRIVDASGLPLIADADNGYGGPLNVRRTIQCFEKAGAAAIHLEDQVFPKRCGHMDGKLLISQADMVAKVKAAVDARRDPDFTIIARTDAIAVEGLEKAIERANAYREAGADIIFIEAPAEEHLGAVIGAVPGPHLYNMASSGKTPFLKASEIEAHGFKVAIYPNWAMFGAIRAAREILRHLRDTGDIAAIREDVVSFKEFFDLLGMQEVRKLDALYASSDVGRLNY
ncbi:oxaloacetate decarboxylase [Microvirga sp. BT689]|uniref:isocitrate lyase/PEP mutase family protein n=1 Tax=Microvirga arvi TaxID=2778731 RepID=UPI00194FDF30|nr:oxaloacetate decarboxylase [Microvirga arvi]MBM6583246.1 oxaloacetate decarboxylase [Microvirga arvi]